MGKEIKKPTSTTQEHEPRREHSPEVPSFSSAMIEMSWRIALPFMLLSLGGIQLDKKYETEPIFSLIGLGLAVTVVGVVVYRFVNSKFPGTFGGKKK